MSKLMLSCSLLFLSFVYWRISNILSRRKHAVEAEARGCEDPPSLSRTGFLGLGRLSEVAKANKEGRTPQWFIEKFEEVGQHVHTFKASALDYELIVTRDPENAKAIFATNANDFEISPHRRDIWSPLLGDGIFTAQGEAWKHSRQLLRPQVCRPLNHVCTKAYMRCIVRATADIRSRSGRTACSITPQPLVTSAKRRWLD